MELLFNKETFSAEFKDNLGFVDTDINYRRILPHVRTATKDVVDILGETNYNKALALDITDNFRVQLKYVVALRAYILYAPTADLAVSNNGRMMRRDDHQVSAFQWQIDANDEALEQQYYRQLDELLRLMAVKNWQVVNPKFQYTDLLVPSLEAFENIFDINGSFYLFLKLVPALREFEAREVKPRMGVYFDKPQIAQDDDLLLNLQSGAVYYALAWGFRRLNAQIFPKGVMQTTITSQEKKAPTTAQYEIQARIFDKDSLGYLSEVEKWVTAKEKLDNPTPTTTPDVFDFGFDDNDGFIDV